MKQALLLIFSFFLVVFLNAQISLESSDYFPEAGDTLSTLFSVNTNGVTISASGGDQNWDFSNLTGGTARSRVIQSIDAAPNPEIFPSANLYIAQQAGGNGFYRSNSASFSILGFEGEDPLGQGLEVETPFSPPYVERWGSLDFFDLNNLNSALTITTAADDIPGNIFDGLPVTPDSIRIRVAINRVDLVDAWGSMIIPGGTFDVLREKRTEIRDVRLDIKVGIFPWADITDTAIELLPIEQLGQDTAVTYSYWSDEAKEPIVIISANADETAINSIEYKFIDIINAVDDASVARPELVVYPNPAVTKAKFKFTNMPTGQYNLDIYNLTGKVVISKQYQIYNTRLETVDLSSLTQGMYIYHLSDEAGNRIVTNRLFITAL